MKKILLTTTALVMTAGVAAAEVSLSGTGQVSLSSVDGADNVLNTHIDLNASVSATAENGMTFSTSVGYDNGTMSDYNDDFTNDVETGNGAWDAGAPEVAIGFNGFTVTAQQDGVDNLFDDAAQEDLGIAGSMGGISFAITSDMDDNDSSYSASYSMGDLTASVVGTNSDDAGVGGSANKVSISYTMGDLTVSASSQNEAGTDEDDQTIGFSYTMDAVSVSYTTINPGDGDMGDEWDASISYSAGALSASYAMDEADETHLIAEYDLGGATAFFSSTSSDRAAGDYQAMGINFSF
jgi:outer membrane protein OmpU